MVRKFQGKEFFTEDTYSVKVEDFLWGLKGALKRYKGMRSLIC